MVTWIEQFNLKVTGSLCLTGNFSVFRTLNKISLTKSCARTTEFPFLLYLLAEDRERQPELSGNALPCPTQPTVVLHAGSRVTQSPVLTGIPSPTCVIP